MRELLLTMSAIFGLVTPIIGIRSTLKGEFKPQRITRLIFLVITLIFVLSLYSQKDRSGIFLAGLQLITSITIFILSLKFGVGGKSRTDLLVLSAAIFTIAIWQITNDPKIALYFAILSDIIGFCPTIIKCYKSPYTEDPKFYLSDVVAGAMSLLAVANLKLNTLAFPLYIFTVNLLCFTLIRVARKKARNKNLSITVNKNV